MFEALRERLENALGRIGGAQRLTEKNIEPALQDVRRALLEADVSLQVAKEFIETVRTSAVGMEVTKEFTPSQALIKVVRDELTKTMGGAHASLQFNSNSLTVILFAGLQGTGKTTTVAKLAKMLKEVEAKKVLTASVDIYRPAAIEQLERLSASIGVDFFSPPETKNVVEITQSAIQSCKESMSDVLIIDTAGRLHVDDEMMSEIKLVHEYASPKETLFVMDATVGQDAVTSALKFHEALPLTGLAVTKLDGDTRGGGLLSAYKVTGKPVKLIGVGEGMEAIEPFYPERIASRILGMGDVVTLIENIERKSDKADAKKLEQKIARGAQFDLEDYRSQLNMTMDMGGVDSIMKYIPNLPSNMTGKMNNLEDSVKKEIALINSMTAQERKHPALIRGSRKARISKGAGVEPQHISRLLRKLEKMQKLSKKVVKNKKHGKVPNIGNLPF